jgi:hypothetical protein
LSGGLGLKVLSVLFIQKQHFQKSNHRKDKKWVSTHPFLEIVWKVVKKVNIHFVKSLFLKGLIRLALRDKEE